MDGVELLNSLNELTSKAKGLVKRNRSYGIALAEADSTYRGKLAQRMLELKAEGMAVTMVEKVALGDVKSAKLERDIAEVNYKASQEELYNLRLQIRVLEAQIKMEWYSNE